MSESIKDYLTIERYFSKPGNYPIQWSKSDVTITDDSGKPSFVQKDVEFPSYFSELSKKIVASRYFYGDPKGLEREKSFKTLVDRVSETYEKWAIKQKYFSKDDAKIFKEEIENLNVTQRMSFNSPVWFNVGTDRYDSSKSDGKKEFYVLKEGNAMIVPQGQAHLYPQTSACFIQSVDDNMEEIMDLAKREAKLFKYGSGTGTDLSTLRSSKEKLSGGGKPSGPLAYLTFYDRVAGIVKSGGKTRRAAKMNSLKIDHPDIKEFIEAKEKEENKIRVLIENGYDSDYGKEAVDTAAFQNANLSVRITDEFMKCVEENKKWKTKPVHNKELSEEMPEYDAKELFNFIARGTHSCGDPGIQFHDTINKWHTCKNTDEIKASNPCSEYMFLDNSSCNLASLNLRGFMNSNGTFNTEEFEQAVKTTAIAMDLNYDNSSYPVKEIAENSHRFRPLGMGYANLGALVMSLGLPYDSDESRAIAASITALMTGKVYETSADLAEKIGPFKEYEKNKEPMINVIKMHRAELDKIDRTKIPNNLENILDEAYVVWDNAVKKGEEYGFRNAQATVLAPTGTIGFMMDCDTKGVEPEIGLVQTKLLAEGGTLRIVNGTVPIALKKLGYDNNKIEKINNYILKNQIAEGCPDLKEEHLSIFDCSNKPRNAKRAINYNGHLKMMAAVQPFLSGAISKTVNLPEEATVEEIEQVYMDAWKMGLKAVAIYRDGSKARQPLSFENNKGKNKLEQKVSGPYRKKLSGTRNSITHKFNVAGHEGYITAGLYEDGQPGEVFIGMSKEGSTVGGFVDAFATSTSFNLQYGVPLEKLIEKFKNQKFEPNGLVLEGHKDIKVASSIIDYTFNWLDKTFLKGQSEVEIPNTERNNIERKNIEKLDKFIDKEELGGFCPSCGRQMVKKGHCNQICLCGYVDQNGCGG